MYGHGSGGLALTTCGVGSVGSPWNRLVPEGIGVLGSREVGCPHVRHQVAKLLPKGLVTWREGVRQATTAAQVAMAFYVLETSIAWHKSIMKAYCQLCHLGDNESSLLLCDGCDKGYHTYCFKPVITNVPEGDWYCYECINKATGVKHCLVCGNQGGKNIITCSTCPRAYHTDCLSPQLSKVS